MRKISQVRIRFVIEDEFRGPYMFVGSGATLKAALEDVISKRKNKEEIEALQELRKELK